MKLMLQAFSPMTKTSRIYLRKLAALYGLKSGEQQSRGKKRFIVVRTLPLYMKEKPNLLILCFFFCYELSADTILLRILYTYGTSILSYCRSKQHGKPGFQRAQPKFILATC
jgi:hypothetical protein